MLAVHKNYPSRVDPRGMSEQIKATSPKSSRENKESIDCFEGSAVKVAGSKIEPSVAKNFVEIETSKVTDCSGKKKKVKTAIFRASESGNIQKLVSALNKGYDPNQPSVGQPYVWPLVVACVFDKKDCVRTLLENGALANVVDEKGKSPLYYTLTQHRDMADMCSLLLTYGAKVERSLGFDDVIVQRFQCPGPIAEATENERKIHSMLHPKMKDFDVSL